VCPKNISVSKTKFPILYRFSHRRLALEKEPVTTFGQPDIDFQKITLQEREGINILRIERFVKGKGI